MSETIVKFIVINKNQSLKFDVNQKNNGMQIFAVDLTNNLSDSNIKINVHHNCRFDLHFCSLNNGFNKQINIELNHDSNSQSNVVIKAFAKNQGITTINLISNVKKNIKNVETNQMIDGILFDDVSKIEVVPSMLIDTNIVKAFHAVNIGNINPEQLFYLMSRGVSKKQAVIILLNAMFASIKAVYDKKGQDLYNSIQQKLIGMVGND